MRRQGTSPRTPRPSPACSLQREKLHVSSWSSTCSTGVDKVTPHEHHILGIECVQKSVCSNRQTRAYPESEPVDPKAMQSYEWEYVQSCIAINPSRVGVGMLVITATSENCLSALPIRIFRGCRVSREHALNLADFVRVVSPKS